MEHLELMEDYVKQQFNTSHNYYKFVNNLSSGFFRNALLDNSYIQEFLSEYDRIKDPYDCILWDLQKEKETIIDTKKRRRTKFEEFNGSFGQEMYNKFGYFNDLYG